MRKLLFNQQRTKIFSLDQVVSIERIDFCGHKGILLEFSNGMRFLITTSEEHLKPLQRHIHDISDCNVVLRYDIYDNFEVNVKLFQFFENKFLKSEFCKQHSFSTVDGNSNKGDNL